MGRKAKKASAGQEEAKTRTESDTECQEAQGVRPSDERSPTGSAVDDPEIERLARETVERDRQKARLWQEAHEKHVASVEARRLLQGCAEYARPGEHAGSIDVGESMDVWYERLGANPTWRDCNAEFSRRWVMGTWVPSVPAVRSVLSLGVVRELPLATSAAEIARKLYLRLLEATDLGVAAERVIVDLAGIRLKLGASRYELQEFFRVLSGQVVHHPAPRHLERAGELYPWQQSNRTRPLAPVRPQDVTVELWDNQRLRFCTEGREICTLRSGHTSTERTLPQAQWQHLTGLVLFHAQKRGTTGAAVDPSAEVRWVMEPDSKKWDTWRRAIPRLNGYLVGRLNLTSDPLRCETHGRVVVCTFGGFSERASPASRSRERSAGMGDEEPAVGNATLPEDSLEDL